MSHIENLFPNLTLYSYIITSPKTPEYNCIAWAVNDQGVWWQPCPFPGYFWPENLSLNQNVDTLVRLFEHLGYMPCDDDSFEDGFEKVAIYGDRGEYTHAAKQLPNGKWTSKLGCLEDIEHDTLDGLSGKEYGSVVCVLKRSKR